MEEAELKEYKENYSCFGKFDDGPVCHLECDISYLCKPRTLSNNQPAQEPDEQPPKRQNRRRKYLKSTPPDTQLETEEIETENAVQPYPCVGEHTDFEGDPRCVNCDIEEKCKDMTEIENKKPPLYDFNKFIEKECRKLVKAAWKRKSEKIFGEGIHPDTIDPNTDPEIQKHYEKIKRRIEVRKKRKIKEILLAEADKIEKELPNLPKIIREDPVIRHNLKRSKFLQIIDYTRDKKYVEQDWRWSIKWANKLDAGRYLHTTKAGEKIKCPYIVVRLNVEELAKYLGLTKVSVWKYLQALCEAKILIDLGKPGKNKPKLYASGYFVPYPKGKKGTYFLKGNPEWKEVLCRLSLQP